MHRNQGWGRKGTGKAKEIVLRVREVRSDDSQRNGPQSHQHQQVPGSSCSQREKLRTERIEMCRRSEPRVYVAQLHFICVAMGPRGSKATGVRVHLPLALHSLGRWAPWGRGLQAGLGKTEEIPDTDPHFLIITPPRMSHTQGVPGAWTRSAVGTLCSSVLTQRSWETWGVARGVCDSSKVLHKIRIGKSESRLWPWHFLWLSSWRLG